MELIDFSNCKITNKTYGGANGGKLSGIYNNEQYMIKLPPLAKAFSDLHYSNACTSEYLGCHIFNLLDIPAQETLLGIYKRNNKSYNVVACKDFTEKDKYVFQDFASLKNQVIDSEEHGYGTELNSLLFTMEEQNLVDRGNLVSFFWDMFVVDAFIGNFDRHNGNWGFLRDRKTDKVTIAPVFDCGSSLNSQASEKDMEEVMTDLEQLKIRIYDRPVSAIQHKGKHLRYFDFLKETDNKDCINSLKKINSKINLNIVYELINTTPLLSDTAKEFYRFILKKRKEMILQTALEMNSNIRKTKANNEKGARNMDEELQYVVNGYVSESAFSSEHILEKYFSRKSEAIEYAKNKYRENLMKDQTNFTYEVLHDVSEYQRPTLIERIGIDTSIGIQIKEEIKKNNSANREGKQMADNKEYTMISGFILPKEEMKVESIAKKDGSGDFKTCNFSFMLGGKATGDENVLVNVKTTSDKLIERIEKGEIKAGSTIALSGLWNSYEKDGKKHVSFVANNNSVLTMQANDVRNIKEGQKVAISGAVVKMGTFKIKIDGKDLKGYSVNLIVDGKAKNDKGEYTESTYVNMKTQNQTQVNLIEKYFKTGKRVMVEGEIKKATFKDKTGKEKEMLYVSTDEGNINLMSSANYIKAMVNGEDLDKAKSASNESVQKEKESKSIG